MRSSHGGTQPPPDSRKATRNFGCRSTTPPQIMLRARQHHLHRVRCAWRPGPRNGRSRPSACRCCHPHGSRSRNRTPRLRSRTARTPDRGSAGRCRVGPQEAAAHAQFPARKLNLLDRLLDGLDRQHPRCRITDPGTACSSQLASGCRPGTTRQRDSDRAPRRRITPCSIEERGIDAVEIHVGNSLVRVETAGATPPRISSFRRTPHPGARRPTDTRPSPVDCRAPAPQPAGVPCRPCR